MQKKEEDDVEEILSSIRDIMSSESLNQHKIPEDVLVLTDMVQEDGTIVPADPDIGIAEGAQRIVSLEQVDINNTESFLSLIEKNTDNLQFVPEEHTPTMSDEIHKNGALNLQEQRKEHEENDLSPEHRAQEDLRVKEQKDTEGITDTGLSPEPVAAPSSVEDISSSKVSTRTQNSTLTSLNRLRQTLEQKQNTAPNSSSNALETIIHDALRPLLQEWINRNLSSVVEAVVTREVQSFTKKLFSQHH
ncbi:MAG: DUF2497 domain-containing protein [Holosporales bacterium]|jgi:cell pole-organizing protein PopZ|nr:DUF2497 domain-containing protein [Holosporales bacterium]